MLLCRTEKFFGKASNMKRVDSDIGSFYICRVGGMGRHKGLKIPRSPGRIGSTPIPGTI